MRRKWVRSGGREYLMLRQRGWNVLEAVGDAREWSYLGQPPRRLAQSTKAVLLAVSVLGMIMVAHACGLI